MDNRELCDDAMFVINNYIEDYYPECYGKSLESSYLKNVSYARWTSSEILKRLNTEIERLPQYLTGDWREPAPPSSIILDFIEDIESYTCQKSLGKSEEVFTIARDIAGELLSLFL